MSIFIITDPADGKKYDIELLPDEVKRFEGDSVFASQKLEEAKHAAALSMENEKENSSVAILQSNDSDNAIYKWFHEAILLLVEEYRIRKDDFNSGKISQKKIWDAISKKLVEKGHIVNGPQCMSKFAGLKRTYKATKDHNIKSGNNTRSWVYYDLMNDLLGHKPFMQPIATVSSSGLAVVSCKRIRLSSESSDSNNQEPKQIPKRSNKQATNANILLEIQKLKQESEENREKRHQEKMKQRTEAIEIMKQIASSLTK